MYQEELLKQKRINQEESLGKEAKSPEAVGRALDGRIRNCSNVQKPI